MNLDLIELQFDFLLQCDLREVKGAESCISLYIYFTSKHDFALKNYRRNIQVLVFEKPWRIVLLFALAAREVKINFLHYF